MRFLFLGALCSLLLPGAPGRHFEENRGQAGKAGAGVQFLARDRGRQVFFLSNEVVWSTAEGSTFRLRFPGASGGASWQAVGNPVGSVSYAIGNDRSQWVSGARQYERVAWNGVYPGIDAVFYWQGERLEYDLVVAPGADAARIRIAWSGAEARLDADGAILVGGGLVKQLAPIVYQGAKRIEGRFVAKGSEFQIALGEYDRGRTLVIDPVLELATYLGGESDDAIVTVSDAFVAGTTASIQFPGAEPARRRSRDVFLRGTPTSGPFQAQVFGTIVIGGSGDEELGGAFFSSSRRTVVLGGTTRSSDFPSPSGPARPLSGPSDGFLMVIDTGSGFGLRPLSSRIVGGSGEDRITALAGTGFAFIFAGETTSSDLAGATGSYAGGIDGFVGHSDFPGLHYLGGSGDDRILSVSTTSYNGCVLGGETRSGDFPYLQPGSPGLRGPSDGFLTFASLAVPTLPNSSYTFESWLVGGSGEDRITAVTQSVYGQNFFLPLISPVAIAGASSSPDLPVRDAAQREHSGALDAFAGLWMAGAAEWLTYIGGTDDDVATGIARNGSGDLFVSGWTRSTDLKTVSAIQERHAGGEDAFYAVVSPGVMRVLTYFGGAGDDRANGLVLVKDAVARLAGWTTSTGLPMKSAWQEERGKGSEGFVADIGSSYVYAPPRLLMAKDGAIGIPARVAQTAPGLPLTYRSSDPSKVLLTDGVTVGAEITAPLGQEVSAEAFAAEGEVEITISAPGFQPAVSRVILFPGTVIASFPTSDLSTWSQPATLSSYWGIIDPVTGRAPVGSTLAPWSFRVRSGFRMPQLQWSSSNENVLRLLSSPSDVYGTKVVEVAGAGVSRIRIEAGGAPVWPADGFDLRVVPPVLDLPESFRLSIGKDLQTGINTSIRNEQSSVQRRPRGVLTVRSEDPSKVVVSAHSERAGVSQVTLPFGIDGSTPALWIQALAGEGETRLVFSSPEFGEERAVVVRLEPAWLSWGVNTSTPTSGQGATIQAGIAHSLGLRLESASGAIASGMRPGVPVPAWRLSNSAPAVLEAGGVTIRPTAGPLTRLIGLSAGTALLTLTPVGASEIGLRRDTVQIEVLPRAASNQFVRPTDSLLLGKDLQTSITFRYFGTGAVTAVSEDANAVLLSTSPSQVGQQSVALSPRQNSDEYVLYFQGLRQEGESAAVIKYPGGEHRIRITLTPSGIGFRSSSPEPGFDRGFDVGVYALEELTGAPLAPQQLMPGKIISASFRTTGAAVRLSRNSIEVTNGPDQPKVSVTLPPLGEEAVLTGEANGRVTEQRLRRAPKTFQLPATATVMRDTVSAFQAELDMDFSSPPTKVVFTSSDPESMLLSLRPDETGRASLEWTATDRRVVLYLHGLKDSGAASVKATAEGYTAAETSVGFAPLRLRTELNSVRSQWMVGVAVRQSVPGRFSVEAQGLRPGAAPLRVRVSTTDAAVATVTPGLFELTGTSISAPFTLAGVGAGTAEILVESERPLVANNSLFVVVVSDAQTIAEPPAVVTIGGQTQVELRYLLGDVNPNGVIATITSSDPSRIAVSRSSTAPGAGSVTVALQPGAGEAAFYVQALAAEGEAVVTVSAAGFASRQWRLRLTPSWFVPVLAAAPEALQIGQVSSISPMLRWSGAGNAVAIPRAGLGPLRLNLQVTNPGVVTLGGTSLTIGEGVSPSTATTSVRADSAGTTLLRFEQPAGFGPVPDGEGDLSLRVHPRTLIFGCGRDGVIEIGRDTQVACRFQSAAPGTTVSVVSSDASRVLVSTNARAAGSGQLSITASDSSELVLQALGSDGTVEVVLSAPGYESYRIAVILRPTMLVFESGSITLSKGSSTGVTLRLLVFNPTGSSPGSWPARAGTSIRAGVTAIPAGVVSIEGPATFAAGENTTQLRLRGDASGTALLQLATPEGFVESARPYISVTVP